MPETPPDSFRVLDDLLLASGKPYRHLSVMTRNRIALATKATGVVTDEGVDYFVSVEMARNDHEDERR